VSDTAQAVARRLAVFDLDGTLTRHDSFGPFVLGLLRRNPWRWLRLPILLIPVLGYLLRLLDRGALKGAVLHTLFSGLPRAVIQAWARAYAAHVVQHELFSEALAAFRAHLAAGDHVVLLSASPDLYVPEIARELGANECICTQIRWTKDQLDGRLASANRRDYEKLRVLNELKMLHPDLPVAAYGNSTVDLPHLYACDQATYVNASAPLATQLGERGLRCVQWQ
jgi:phosphatidylglycerophosphatase C